MALALLVGWLGLCPVERVLACSTVSMGYVIDPSLREQDSEAPAPFANLTAFTRRVASTRCEGNRCTQSTCGDHGQLELTFDARADGVGPDAIGYRVVWLSGELPVPARAVLEGVKPLVESGRVTLDVGWNEVPQLSGELALIAVDRAGNESAQSDPVHVEWSGCLSYWDDPTCRSAAAERVSGGPAAHGCDVTAASRLSGLPAWLWLSAVSLTVMRMRKRRLRA